jgi:acylphosphatase
MRKAIRIYGKVQGVWFRASTKAEAERLGLYGFVRNEQDGSVYLEARGESEKLQQLIDWCRRGPQLAEVSDVVVNDLDDRGEDYGGSFVIKR